MSNWKKEFDREFITNGIPNVIANPKRLKFFISKEIIEKILADIPDKYDTGRLSAELLYLKQQLRSKWLNN